jgi:metal-sulfur cluster biosynthetic enzyme
MNESEIGTTQMRPESSGEPPASTDEAPAEPTSAGVAAPGGDGAPDREAILDALRNVFDPELGINIVDLGLVYDVAIDGEGGVDITYSLTTMGCPIGPMIEDQMRQFLAGVPGVGEVRPEMVLRPPWSPEMMSDEAKAALGIF